MKLSEYLSQNPDGYEIDSHGIIQSPGKFEGEPLYVPFFHGQACEGFADRSFGDVSMGGTHVDLFELTDEDRAAHVDLAGCTVLSIEEHDQGFISCSLWGGETLDQVETELDPPADYGPDEGDYTLSDCGPHGARTSVAQHNQKWIGNYASDDEALAAIREHMRASAFYPNVWRVSDHGNASLVEGFTCESRGTWIAEGRDDEDENGEGGSSLLTFHAKDVAEAQAIKSELRSFQGASIEGCDGMLYVVVPDDEIDEARAELRLANFDLEVRS